MIDWVLVAELLIIPPLLARQFLLPRWRRRFPSKVPRYVGTPSLDNGYERYVWFKPLPQPLDPLTIEIAIRPQFFGFVRDERRHEEGRVGAMLRGEAEYAIRWANTRAEVLAVFRTFDEYLRWKQDGTWPKFTGDFDVG